MTEDGPIRVLVAYGGPSLIRDNSRPKCSAARGGA